MEENDFEGEFIVVEGPDGAGTTTQSKRLAEELDAYWTREPAGNKIGEKVDELISSDEYSPETVALAFAADRMVHLEEEVIPKLEDGKTVVCDRYYHSSLVYQPAAGADYNWIESANRNVVRPDQTFILDVDAETGMSRVEERGKDGNIFEDLSFQEKAIRRYRQLDQRLEEEIRLIDGSKSKEEVFDSILELVDP